MHRHYRKLIAGAVGIGVLLLRRYAGIDLTGTEAMVVDLIVSGLTLLGIERLRNDPAKQDRQFNGEHAP